LTSSTLSLAPGMFNQRDIEQRDDALVFNLEVAPCSST